MYLHETRITPHNHSTLSVNNIKQNEITDASKKQSLKQIPINAFPITANFKIPFIVVKQLPALELIKH